MSPHQIKKAEILVKPEEDLNIIYESFKEALLHKCERFPEFSFDIKKDTVNSKIIIRSLDLSVQAN